MTNEEKDTVYTEIQNILRPGLAIIIGSGASCSYNLPSMGDLATYLQKQIDCQIEELTEGDQEDWSNISKSLNEGIDLETSMSSNNISDDLYRRISSHIVDCIEKEELRAITDILSDPEIPAIGRLMKHLLSPQFPHLDIITTNYDRLIEISATRAETPVDSMFTGSTLGRFCPESSARSQLFIERVHGSRNRITTRSIPHIRLHKPHGSLDWFKFNDEDYRSDIPLNSPRSIVAPGKNKYIEGYNVPFDTVRSKANEAIDRSSSLLFIGYGFNDNHLQTHIDPRMKVVPSLILSRSLTDSATIHLDTNSQSIGIYKDKARNNSSIVRQRGTDYTLDSPIWNLDDLMKEVIRK